VPTSPSLSSRTPPAASDHPAETKQASNSSEADTRFRRRERDADGRLRLRYTILNLAVVMTLTPIKILTVVRIPLKPLGVLQLLPLGVLVIPLSARADHHTVKLLTVIALELLVVLLEALVSVIPTVGASRQRAHAQSERHEQQEPGGGK
jgi:hypothetical protein